MVGCVTSVLLQMFLIGAILAGPGNSDAGTAIRPDHASGRIRFTNISSQDGLSDNRVTCIFQDSKGFVWFATRDGLNKYDGHTLSVYKSQPDKPSSLGANRVHQIIEDASGTLWVVTNGGGLNRYDRRNDEFTHFMHVPGDSSSLHDDFLVSVALGANDDLWLGSSRAGLGHFSIHDNRFSSVSLAEDGTSASHNKVNSLLHARSGAVWTGTEGGLLSFDPLTSEISRFDFGANAISESSRRVLALAEGDGDVLWLGTGAGLGRFDLRSASFELLSDSDAAVPVPAAGVFPVPGKSLAVAVANRLRFFDQSLGRFLQDELSLAPGGAVSAITSAMRDNTGRWWLGTDGNGVFKSNDSPARFKVHEIRRPGLSSRALKVNAFCESREGVIWVGTNDGLGRFDGRENEFRWQMSSGQRELADKSVTSVVADDADFLWLGTSEDGLLGYDTRTGIIDRRFDLPRRGETASPASSSVTALAAEPDGPLWIGTTAGLFRLGCDGRKECGVGQSSGPPRAINDHGHNPEELRASTLSAKIHVTALLLEPTGILWVGTANDGLCKRMPDGSFFTYRQRDEDVGSLSSDEILAISQTNSGTIYVGTEHGLNMLDPTTGQAVAFTTSDGLPDNTVTSVLPDHTGFLWLSTKRGLSRFDPARARFLTFDQTDGLRQLEFAPNAALTSSTGRLLFGSGSSFVSFEPEKIVSGLVGPQALITAVRVFDEVRLRDIASSDSPSLSLDCEENSLSFEFTSLDFGGKGSKLAYRLEGLDEDWVDANSRKYATYANLGPGNYTFRVVAADRHGVRNEQGTAFHFQIVAPWWQQVWFRLLVLCLGMTLLAVAYRARTNVVRSQRIRLEMLVQERTAQLHLQKNLAETDKETIVRQAHKLQEMDKHKSRLFANISHEFRTPLTLILSPLENMMGTAHDEETRSSLSLMRRNTDRLVQLIDQLLELSKIETGNVEVRSGQVELVSFLNELVLSFAPLAERNRQSLTCHCDAKILSAITDHEKLETIVTNLLSNACKFTQARGEIHVSLSRQKGLVRDGSAGEMVVIAVKDSGPGIDRHELSRVFERFYQADTSTTRQHSGSGIGLALAKELVELLGGDISVQSQLGEGSCFTVRIPLVQVKKSTRNGSPVASRLNGALASRLRCGTLPPIPARRFDPGVRAEAPVVLIVEDNADVKEYLRTVLSRQFRVLSASDGKAGLALAQEKSPDLIISDIMMPGLDGHELCSSLRASERTSHIPIILLTAHASARSRVQALEGGADDYLVKPFTTDDLVLRAQNLIAQRRHLREKFGRQLGIEPRLPNVTSADQTLLDRLCKTVEEKMDEPEFGPEALRSLIGMSRTQLHRKVRGLTDRSPSQFIRSMRLKRARQLIEKKAGSISEIAFQVGFNNLSWFSKCFREEFGCLPSEVEPE